MAELSSNSKNMLLLQQQLQHLTTMVPLIVTELESLHSKVATLEEKVARLEPRVETLEEPRIKYISEEQFKKMNFTHSESVK